MNKFIIGLILAAVLCFLGAPFATGLVAQSHLEARVEAIDTNNPWLDARVASYDRGWFTSDAVVELALDLDDAQIPVPAEGLLETFTAPVPVAIALTHGPVGFDDSLFFGVASVKARPDPEDANVRELSEMLGVPYLFEFRGRSGFGGRFDFDADSPPFMVETPIGEVRSSGLAVDGFAAGRGLTVRGALDEVGLQGFLASGAVESVAFEFDYEFRPDRLPLSRGTFTLGRVVAASPMMGNEPIFELTGLSIEQSIDMSGDDETVDAQVQYRSDRLLAGSDTDLSEVALGIRVAGLDARAAADYYAVMDRAFDAPAVEPEQLMAELTPVLEALVRRGFTIEIEPAGFSSDLGTLNLSALADVDGSSLPADAPVDVRNIAVLLDVLTVDADLAVTKALARDLAARVVRAQLVASAAAGGEPFSKEELEAAADAQAGLMLVALAGQGMLEDDGTDYRMTIRFEDAALTVNGQPLGAGFL